LKDNDEVVGFAPIRLQDAKPMLARRLTESGYTLVASDSEPDETEGTFSGNGWTGRYWVRPVMTYQAVTEWVVIALKQ
jgi:hypothetical protein